MALTAADIIARLELRPHPEGGHYRETFRDTGTDAQGRSRSTAIYYLLRRGERSHWHRVDAAEAWHWHAGGALELRINAGAGTQILCLGADLVSRGDALALQIANDGCGPHTVRLGADLAAGERPQAIVPVDAWQSAESTGDWTLVGCTVAPGFEFAKFELAPKDWAPV